MESKPQEDQKEGGKKDWAEMSDEEGGDNDGKDEEQQVQTKPEPKRVIPPTQKGTKNKQGDYIVTKIQMIDDLD